MALFIWTGIIVLTASLLAASVHFVRAASASNSIWLFLHTENIVIFLALLALLATLFKVWGETIWIAAIAILMVLGTIIFWVRRLQWLQGGGKI
jgi:hypothetical protein